MSKKKDKKRREREKRQQRKRKRGPGQREADKRRGAQVKKREHESSLEGMKRAPAPELLPAVILAAGACLPVLGVRYFPGWPAWAHVAVFVGALVVATLAARQAAKRRIPKWDPLLFFGVAAFAAAVSWSGDAGEIWVVNSSDEVVAWSVDGGLETKVGARQKARLDLRRGRHKLTSAAQIIDFSLERGERLVLTVGTSNCVDVGGNRRRESMFRLRATDPAPAACPAEREAAVPSGGPLPGAGPDPGQIELLFPAKEPSEANMPAPTGRVVDTAGPA